MCTHYGRSTGDARPPRVVLCVCVRIYQAIGSGRKRSYRSGRFIVLLFVFFSFKSSGLLTHIIHTYICTAVMPCVPEACRQRRFVLCIMCVRRDRDDTTHTHTLLQLPPHCSRRVCVCVARIYPHLYTGNTSVGFAFDFCSENRGQEIIMVLFVPATENPIWRFGKAIFRGAESLAQRRMTIRKKSFWVSNPFAC